MFALARFATIGALIFLSSLALADFQWTDNFAWDRARVITPRQNSWSFRSSYQTFDSRFGSTGEIQNLGQPFDRTWTWKQVLAGSSTNAQDESVFQSYMRSNNLNESDIAAATTFNLKREESTFEISWAYGLSERWMIGLQVPISYVTTQLLPNTSLASAGITATSQDVRQRVAAFVKDRLAAEGYDELQPQTRNLIVGDVSLLNQFALWQNLDWALSLQQISRIPSTPNNNVADYIRYSRGDGQIDLGLTAMLDRQWKSFLFGGKVGYIKAIPDTQKMRVPATDNSFQFVDRSVHRNLGDLISTSFETFYNLSRKWTINGAYLGFFKGADHYSGPDASPDQYNQLGADSAQELHIARAGISYLIGNSSSRNGIERKWIANFNVYDPISGQNISEGPEASLELQAFF